MGSAKPLFSAQKLQLVRIISRSTSNPRSRMPSLIKYILRHSQWMLSKKFMTSLFITELSTQASGQTPIVILAEKARKTPLRGMSVKRLELTPFWD